MNFKRPLTWSCRVSSTVTVGARLGKCDAGAPSYIVFGIEGSPATDSTHYSYPSARPFPAWPELCLLITSLANEQIVGNAAQEAVWHLFWVLEVQNPESPIMEWLSSAPGCEWLVRLRDTNETD